MLRPTSQPTHRLLQAAQEWLPPIQGNITCWDCRNVMTQSDDHGNPVCQVCSAMSDSSVASAHSPLDLGPLQGSLPLRGPSAGTAATARPTMPALQLTTQMMEDRYTPSSGCTSPMTVTTDSDSSVASTNRASSSNARRLAQAQRSVERIRRNGHSVEDYYCPTCRLQNCGVRGHRKNGNERTQRSAIQSYIQTLEDILRFLCHSDGGKAQSSGNGTSSGLEHTKIDILEAIVNLFQGLLEDSIKEDLRDGIYDLSRHFQRLQGISNRNPNDNLLPGRTRDQCTHAGKEKKCIVHGTPDWTQCRKERKEAQLKHNLSRYRANL